ncbi:hypothetical protein Bca101_017683 [Brassica carinata]
MEKDVAHDDVSSPSHSLAQIADNNTTFVSNFPSPPSQAKISDFFDSLTSQAAKAETDVNFDVANSSDSYDMVQRSRGGCCLKPSHKLKDMEWFTIGGKRRRG